MLAILCMTLSGVLVIRVFEAPAWRSGERIDQLDVTMARLRRLESLPGFKADRLSAAERNLFALAERWPKLRAPRLQLQGIAAASNSPRASNGTIDLRHSRYSGFTQSETSTAWCGPNVVMAFNDTSAEVTTIAGGRGVSMDGYSVSHDRGATFTYMGSPAAAADPDTFMSGDPVVACANGATFYYVSVWFDGTHSTSGVSLSQSSDHGQTFETPRLVAGASSDTHIIDKAWIAVDPNTTSRLYVAYTDIDFSGAVCGTESGSPVPRYAIEAVNSPDGGTTWSAPPVVVAQVCADPAHPFAFINGAQVVVGPSGEVYVAWEMFGNIGGLGGRTIQIAKSVNAGATFSAPVTVANINCAGDCNDWQGLFHSNEYPSVAIGKGPFNRGRIYLAWNDGDRQVPDSLTTTGFYNFTDIMFSQSADGGATWSVPVRVNDNPEGPRAPMSDRFEPALATDDTGRITICFYDRRNDPYNFLIDRYCASSPRGGLWTNRRITFKSFAPLVGEDILVAPDYMGDYDTLASDFLDRHSGFVGGYGNNSQGNPRVAKNVP